MAQVLTADNLADFHATGKIPEFVKPTDKPAEVIEEKPVEVKSVEVELDDKVEDDQGLTAAERKAYSEKIARKISAKHRALKQAEAAIGTETKGRQAAEKLASDLRQELTLLKSAAAGDGAPKEKDFEDAGAYWKAVMRWTADQAVATDRLEREKERIAAERQERIAKFADTVDNWDDAVEALKGTPQHQAVLDYIADAELGPALLYYFSSHPDEYEKLTRLRPVFAVAEVGKIETKLERKAQKVEKTEKADEALDTFKTLSKAPAPIQALNESATVVTKDPSNMSFDELREYNREQRMKRRS